MTLMAANQPTEIEQFANNAFFGLVRFLSNPKIFDEISHYLEENAEYLPGMTIFDDAWQLYLEKMN